MSDIETIPTIARDNTAARSRRGRTDPSRHKRGRKAKPAKKSKRQIDAEEAAKHRRRVALLAEAPGGSGPAPHPTGDTRFNLGTWSAPRRPQRRNQRRSSAR